MHKSLFEMLLKSSFTCILVFLAGTPAFWAGGAAGAQNQWQLRPDVPRLDNNPSIHQPMHQQQSADVKPADKPKGTLKGKIEKRGRYGNSLGGQVSGRQFGLWGKGRSGISGRGRATTDGLEGLVESGIGIIGVRFVLLVGRAPVINRVFAQTPAAGNGLKVNDVIVAVDGVPTFGLTKEEVYDMIVGAPGSMVTLSIKRAGDYMAVTMTRMDLNDITDPFVRRDYMMSM